MAHHETGCTPLLAFRTTKPILYTSLLAGRGHVDFHTAAHSVATAQGSGPVQTVTSHHERILFFETAGHGYLIANVTDAPLPILHTLMETGYVHRVGRYLLAVGEEDRAYAVVMLVAAELYPDADWDRGMVGTLGRSVRLERAYAAARRWFEGDVRDLLQAFRDAGEPWSLYATELESVPA